MSAAHRTFGFSWPVLIGLAALAAPRIVLHDLGIIQDGSVISGLLVFVPLACWVATVLWRRPTRPFLTVVVIGAIYGVFLAVGHQVLWTVTFDGPPPTLGGIAPAVLRAAAVVSSLFTGTLIGVVTGAVALLLTRIVPVEPGDDRSTRPR